MPDYGRLLEAVPSAKTLLGGDLPLQFQIRLVRANIIDLQRMSKFDAMTVPMSIVPEGAFKKLCLQNDLVFDLNREIFRHGLAYLLDSTGKGPRCKARNAELLSRLCGMALAITSDPTKMILPQHGMDDLAHIPHAFGVGDMAASKENQQHALSKFDSLAQDYSYSGILFNLINHPNFGVMKGIALAELSAKQGKDDLANNLACSVCVSKRDRARGLSDTIAKQRLKTTSQT